MSITLLYTTRVVSMFILSEINKISSDFFVAKLETSQSSPIPLLLGVSRVMFIKRFNLINGKMADHLKKFNMQEKKFLEYPFEQLY